METNRKGVLSLFVHLGGPPPEHLLLNIQRFEKMFPDNEAMLILSKGAEMTPKFRSPVIYIGEESFPELLEMSKAQDFEFRSGFWKNTFLRIFAIKHLQELFPDRRVLHIESDVLLFPDFPWSEIGMEKKLSWMRVHDGADIAALVYSPSLLHISELTINLESYSQENPFITDMSALFRFASDNPDKVSYLPSLTETSCKEEALNEKFFTGSKQYPHGYFDPLGIGIWLFGQDPKNNYGFIRRYVPQNHHDLDPRNLKVSIDEEGLLTDISGNSIYSLHIHSKNLKLFGSNWNKHMARQLDQAQRLKAPIIFVPKKFLNSLQDRPLISHIWIAFSKFEGFQRIKKNDLANAAITKLKKFLKIR